MREKIFNRVLCVFFLAICGYLTALFSLEFRDESYFSWVLYLAIILTYVLAVSLYMILFVSFYKYLREKDNGNNVSYFYLFKNEIIDAFMIKEIFGKDK